LAQVIGKIRDSTLDFGAVARSGLVLATFCAALPKDADPYLPDWVIPRQIPWGDEYCALILGPRDRLDAVKYLMQSVKGRVIERPPDAVGQRPRHRASTLAQGRRARRVCTDRCTARVYLDPSRPSQVRAGYPVLTDLTNYCEALRGLPAGELHRLDDRQIREHLFDQAPRRESIA
jgi:hypothetical protein